MKLALHLPEQFLGILVPEESLEAEPHLEVLDLLLPSDVRLPVGEVGQDLVVIHP